MIPRRAARVGAAIMGVALPVAAAHAQGDPEFGGRMAGQWCASCHDVGRPGAPAVRASDTAPAFAEIAAARNADYLRAFLARPHAPMPPLTLSRQEIEDLTAYIRGVARR